jgi:hypothetical protein
MRCRLSPTADVPSHTSGAAMCQTYLVQSSPVRPLRCRCAPACCAIVGERQEVQCRISAGYFWFGNQSPALGGFPLPAYANWNAGVTFTRNRLHLDLRYYDTNLSRENCFVFTGDPNARPGGRADPLTNPEGLTSGWCSATVVAKFWFTLD